MYKILIVEDDTTIANGLKNHLEKWNYEVDASPKVGGYTPVKPDTPPVPPTPWISYCHFLMDFTGVRKSERFQKFQLFSSHRRMII